MKQIIYAAHAALELIPIEHTLDGESIPGLFIPEVYLDEGTEADWSEWPPKKLALFVTLDNGKNLFSPYLNLTQEDVEKETDIKVLQGWHTSLEKIITDMETAIASAKRKRAEGCNIEQRWFVSLLASKKYQTLFLKIIAGKINDLTDRDGTLHGGSDN